MSRFVDVSTRAVLEMSGPDGVDFLQRVSTNDMSPLMSGGQVQTVLTNEKGRILDVPTVLFSAKNKLLLVAQTNSPGWLYDWLEKFIIMEDLVLEDLTPAFSHFLFFPYEVKLLESLRSHLPQDAVLFEENWGDEKMCHALVRKGDEPAVSSRVVELGIELVGMEAFETFRIFRGIPGFPNELSDEHNPLEANLASLIGRSKGCYIGQEVIARLDTYQKVQNRLVRLQLSDIPTSLPAPFFKAGKEAGILTSASWSDVDERCWGLGFVKTLFSKEPEGYVTKDAEETITVTIVP